MKIQDNYIRKAKVLSVYDGDTMTLLVDCGYYTLRKITVRLLGVDTPEIRTKNKEEKERGIITRDWVRSMTLNEEVMVKSIKNGKGKFGRFLCEIYVGNICINKELVKRGMATSYWGGKRG